MASSAPESDYTLSCGGAHDAQAQLPHVVIFPFMGKSHTIPLADLTHLLRRRQLATVTFLTTPGNAGFVRAALAGADGVAIVELPFTDNLIMTNPGVPPRPETTDALDSPSSFLDFLEYVSVLQPRFEEALAALRPPASAVVADAFLYWAHASAAARGVPTLAFFGTNAFAHVMRDVLLRDNPASVLTSGTTPDAVFTVPEFPHVQLTLADLPFPFNDASRTGRVHEVNANIEHAIANSQGLIVNTFDAMEGRYIQHWNRQVGPRSWPVGPLCLARTAGAPWHGDVAKPAWMRWLDEKAAAGGAVLYVAFGTVVSVSGSQLRDVADGLDRAGLDFIWAVKPVDADLGAGFEERVKGRGMVVREWVDQRAILAHECVRGFLSHGGWNSVLESISAGVPLAVWPMGAEQPLNAKLLVDELGVGIRVPPEIDAVSGMARRSEQIARVTSDLMNGETGAEATRKMALLAAKAREAVAEAGSSWRALEELIREFGKQITQS